MKMVFLQKKRENLRKGSRVIATVFCVFLLVSMAIGCGKVEEPIPVQLSSGTVEELQNGTTEEKENNAEKETVGDVDYDPEDVSGGESKVDAGDDIDQNEESGSSDENDQQTKEAQSQSVGSAELEGNVRSIGVDSFVVARNEVWSEVNASYAVGAAPGYEDEEDLITVHVRQDCVWEFKTVKNGGIDPEDVSTGEGSFADLKEGISTISKGSWQDDGSFLADSIVMMLFV